LPTIGRGPLKEENKVNQDRLAKPQDVSPFQDAKLDVKLVLSGLWISMLFIFAYVDIFGFWRADVINGALAGKVPGPDFKINQAFLAFTTIYIVLPSLMVVFTLVAPARVNRNANIVASLLYAVSVIVSVIGETWTYYILGSVLEVILLLSIARVAWMWPRRSHRVLDGSAERSQTAKDATPIAVTAPFGESDGEHDRRAPSLR
jgi:Family of unknown function (DUF6326)